MKFFFDTEFLEGPQDKRILGIPYQTENTIDLISIGIVNDFDEEYYEVSKEFNLKMLLNRFGKTKEEIAKGILSFVRGPVRSRIVSAGGFEHGSVMYYTEDTEEVQAFRNEHPGYTEQKYEPGADFYAYYADYDWVVFCWIFGKMIMLPDGFPMYCRDLKQSLDDKAVGYINDQETTINQVVKKWKRDTDYPTQFNEHNALADAKWNKKLYTFINSL